MLARPGPVPPSASSTISFEGFVAFFNNEMQFRPSLDSTNLISATAIRLRKATARPNAALISFLAGRLNVPARTIVLLRGHKSRDKLVRFDGLSEEELRRGLL